MSETVSNPHRIEVTDPESTFTRGVRIVCDAPVGAPCRMHCDVCEEYLEDDHDTHELHDQGYCIKIEGWFDDFPADCYDGDVLAFEALHAGPVILTWNGDWMVWKYDEPTDHENRSQA
jgi:hypothetical protein